MALKDIFKMIKADRYTADGCEEIKKAQEAIKEETADAGLPDGTMRHRKDGDYIKQAGKWVPAKKGNGGAKKKGPDMNAEAEKHAEAHKDRESASSKQKLSENYKQEVKEYVSSATPERVQRYIKALRTPFSIERDNFEEPDKLAEALEIELKKKTESKPAAGSGSAPSANQSELLAKKRQWDAEGGPANEAERAEYDKLRSMKKLKEQDPREFSVQLEKLHSKYNTNKWNDLYRKISQDSAPRVLTGDCKVRIRKETTDGGLPDGSVSHRKDGDYIKKAGKWVPAPAAKGKAGKSPANKPDKVGDFMKAYERGDFGKYQQNAEQKKAESFFKEKSTKSKPAEAKTYKNEEGRRDFRAAFTENPKDSYDFAKTVEKSIPMSQGDKEELKNLKSFMQDEGADYKQALRSRASNLVDGNKSNGDWYPEKEKSIMKIAKAVGYDKELHQFIEEEYRGYDLGYSEDAAPRQLTGDCKVRIKKS